MDDGEISCAEVSTAHRPVEHHAVELVATFAEDRSEAPEDVVYSEKIMNRLILFGCVPV